MLVFVAPPIIVGAWSMAFLLKLNIIYLQRELGQFLQFDEFVADFQDTDWLLSLLIILTPLLHEGIA